jgi:hypothetical protein
MKNFLLLLLLAANFNVVSAQKTNGNTLSPGAALLFKDVKSTLSVAEKNFIYSSLKFGLSKDRKSFTDGENQEETFDARVYPTDMNKDGLEEVFVSFGNTYTSGMTGSSIELYIKKAGGMYKANFGFPGTVPVALLTGNAGYPDLLIGGPGFEFPVWKWNGTQYVFSKKMKETVLTKLKTVQVEDMSLEYQQRVK